MTAPYYTDELVTVYAGDCRDIAARLSKPIQPDIFGAVS